MGLCATSDKKRLICFNLWVFAVFGGWVVNGSGGKWSSQPPLIPITTPGIGRRTRGCRPGDVGFLESDVLSGSIRRNRTGHPFRAQPPALCHLCSREPFFFGPQRPLLLASRLQEKGTCRSPTPGNLKPYCSCRMCRHLIVGSRGVEEFEPL